MDRETRQTDIAWLREVVAAVLEAEPPQGGERHYGQYLPGNIRSGAWDRYLLAALAAQEQEPRQ